MIDSAVTGAAVTGAAVVGPDGRVVVVGGGVAGLSVAVELRRLGHVGPVVVLDRGAVLHDRPPLSKSYLRGEVAADDLAPYPSQQLLAQGVQVRTGTVAVSLDPGAPDRPAVVGLADGTALSADAVVLAEGGRAHRLPVPGQELALQLRTLDDARALRPLLRPGRRLVVLGAGLVGAEVAATAVGLGLDVTLVDPDPLPLAGVLGPEVARVLVEDHGRHGVRVVVAAAERLEAAPTTGGPPVRVRLSDGSTLEADVVLVATGMAPVDDLARAAGLEVAVGGGTLVDRRQRTSSPCVLAVGDGTRRRRAHGGVAASAGHWDAARLDGLAAAAALLGHDVPVRGAPWFWTDRHGRHVEVVGDPVGGSRSIVRGVPGTGPFAVLGWRDGVLTGAVAVDDARTTQAARRLVDRAVVVDPDELADPATDLRALARG